MFNDLNMTQAMEYSFDLLTNRNLLIPTYLEEVTNNKVYKSNIIECEKCSMNILSSEETSKQMCAISRTTRIIC